MRKFFVLFLMTPFLFAHSANGEEPSPLWNKINGSWKIQADPARITDESQKTWEYGYSELINNRSIISCAAFSHITSIRTTLTPADAGDGNMLMIFFASSEYRKFHAFRLVGDKQTIHAVQFIQSDVIDPEKPKSLKNNFSISILSEKKIDLAYGSPLSVEIDISDTRAKISINRTFTFSAEAGEKLSDGSFGISHRLNALTVSSFQVFSGRKKIFEDDFSADRIKRPKAVMSVTTDGKK
jgi:hypothetical protein